MKKITKIFAVLTAIVLTLTVGFGCSAKKEGTLEVYMPMGAPALAMAQLMAERDSVTVKSASKETEYKLNYHIVSASGASDSIANAVKTAKPDVALVPVNAAVTLLGTGGADNGYADKYKIVSVNTHGNLFLLRKGSVPADEVTKVAVKNLSAVPGLTYKAVLGAGNFTDNESEASAQKQFLVNIGDDDQPVPFLTTRGFDAIVVPEPACTNIMNSPAATSLNLQKTSLQDAEIWGESKSYAQAVMIVRKNLATEEFVDRWNELMTEAANWLKQTNEDGTLKNAAAALKTLSDYRDNSGLTVPFSEGNLTKECVEGCSVFVTSGVQAKSAVLDYLNKINSVVPGAIGVPTDEYFFV